MTLDKKTNLRHTFVGMLFALAVAQAAILYGDLFKVVAYGWNFEISISGLLNRLSFEDYLLLAPSFHLLLGIFLVADSWVGWSKSMSKGNQGDLNVFHLSFVLLLVEVLLLVLYFILIISVELDYGAFQVNHILSDAIPSPSSAPEATLIFMIFFVYAIWDILSDVIADPIASEHYPMQSKPHLSKIITFLTGVTTYASVSFVCVLIAWIIQSKAIEGIDPNSAIWGDVALIFLLLFFRASKNFECLFMRLFKWEATRSGSRTRVEIGNEFKTIALMGLLLFIIYYSYCQMI